MLISQHLFFAALVVGFLAFFCFSPQIRGNGQGERIASLVRQASRWATAAEQDKNAMIALLHANYAAGYLWALRDIASDTEIEAAVPGLSLPTFIDEIVATQDKATRRVSSLCPAFAPTEPPYLVYFSGEA